MQFRNAVPAVSLACFLASCSAPASAAPKVAPAAKLAPLCEAHMTMVNQKIDPSALPIKVLQDHMKVGPYVASNPQKKLGGVKVTTVPTGRMEYQDGSSRTVAPFICTPSIATMPLVGAINPASIRMVVVFPAPFGPSSATISPAAT